MSCCQSLSCVWLFATPWTVAYQAPLSMKFSRQEYWSGLPFPPLGDLLNPGIEPRCPELQADSLPSEPPEEMLSKWDRIDRGGTMVNWAWLPESVNGKEVALGTHVFKGSLVLSGGHGLCNKSSRPLGDSRKKIFVQELISGLQKCIYSHLMQFPKVLIKLYLHIFYSRDLPSPIA